MSAAKSKNLSVNLPYGPVRVTIPAKMAFNLPELESGIDRLVDALGCGKCFSGADCSFLHEREFVLGELKAGPHPDPWRAGPQPEPWRQARLQAQQVTVVLSKDVAYDLPAVKNVLAKILDLAGCPCHSGLDISYLSEINLVSRVMARNVEQQLEQQGFAIVGGF